MFIFSGFSGCLILNLVNLGVTPDCLMPSVCVWQSDHFLPLVLLRRRLFVVAQLGLLKMAHQHAAKNTIISHSILITMHRPCAVGDNFRTDAGRQKKGLTLWHSSARLILVHLHAKRIASKTFVLSPESGFSLWFPLSLPHTALTEHQDKAAWTWMSQNFSRISNSSQGFPTKFRWKPNKQT